MSNILTTNPLVCDTAGVLLTGLVKPKALSWRSTEAKALVAANDLVLSKASGAVITGKRATFDGDGIEMQHFPDGFTVDGLTLTTIDGGILSIYL